MVAAALSTKGFNLLAFILAPIIGAGLGRVAGQFVKRKLKNTNVKVKNIIQIFYISYLRIISTFTRKLINDVNQTRIILENVPFVSLQSIEKFRLVLFLAKSDKSDIFYQTLQIFESILSIPENKAAINLSWKVFLLEAKKSLKENELDE